ncbi:uncharacterized protein PHACADRAFT_107190, partial [Phanerochaete carnosa HHB-10118-sp]
EKQRRRQFNKLLSGKCILVEHTFGMLKGCFPALKVLSTPNNIDDVYRIVKSLMALHNICIDLGDHPEDIYGYDPSDDPDVANGNADIDVDLSQYGGVTGDEPADIPVLKTEAALQTAGYEMRLHLLNALCPVE